MNRRLRAHAPWIALLLAVALAVAGRPVPSGNELVYLLEPYRLTHPAFLANDWTYAVPWKEHLVFNWAAGLLMKVMPLVLVGWLGRLACWVLILAGLLRLGRRFELPAGLAALGIILWLGAGQALVGGEWMIGGFEAKVPAYVMLVFALDRLLDGRERSGGLLLGLCFTLHPAVGMQGAVAAAAGLVFLRWPVVRLMRTTAWAVLTGLPGMVTSLMLLSAPGGSASDWRLVVLGREPWHVDPWSFSHHLLALLGIMLAFNALWFARRRQQPVVAFFGGFQLALGGFFLLGLGFRASGWFQGMELMPFRLLPLFVPLLFWWQLAAAWKEGAIREPLLAGVALLALTGSPGVLGTLITRSQNTARAWRSDTPLDQALRWIAGNTPGGSVILTPPAVRQGFHLMRRGQVVSWDAIRYDRLEEWVARVEALGAPARVIGEVPPDSVNAGFLRLSPDSLRALARRYGATWLLSHAGHPFPARATFGAWTVYQIPGGAADGPTGPELR